MKEHAKRDAMNAYYGRDAEALARSIHRLTNLTGALTMTDKTLVLAIARVAHEVNREYCISHGDYTQLPWENASDDQRSSAFKGVKMHLENPDATPEDSHKSWMEEKTRQGWKYGAYKDEANKLHPCMVPYAELDERQRAKDYIFRGIVRAIAREMARP